MRPVVQFDVDGVLADFAGGYIRLWCQQTGQPFPIERSAIKWDDLWDKNVWAEIRDSVSFWSQLPMLASARQLRRVNYLQSTADVYFVTSRVGRYPKAQTEEWLERYGVRHPTVLLSSKKGEIARALRATYAIDDKAGNAVFIQYHSPETASYLLDAPYNRFDAAALGSKVVRVDSLDDFLDVIEWGVRA